MIPAQVFCRVVSVTTESGRRGTGFLTEHDGGMALITARHVCSGEPEELIDFQQAWGDAAPVRGYLDRIGLADATTDADVAAFDIPQMLRPDWFVGRVALSSDGLIWGQDCYILGYPFGLASPIGGGGQQLPIIKKGIIAGSSGTDGSPGGARGWYVDALANPGFSGGPLVYEVAGTDRQYAIAGVVSGSYSAPIEEPSDANPTPLRAPSGLSYCTDVGHVRELGIHQA